MRRLPGAARGLALAACLVLAGCGFTPLYATPDLVAGLAAVEVTTPEGRAGALLRWSSPRSCCAEAVRNRAPPH